MLLLSTLAFAGPALNDPARPYAVELSAELGFVAPLSHRLQLGTDGDELNYIQDGGQNILFAFARPTAALRWRRQSFTLVYQPLDLRTTESPDQDLQINGTVFPAGRPIDFQYGFSFWRLSWGHRVVAQDDLEVSLGLGLQIRNATLGFTSVDGSLSEFNRDIGPVPLLEFEVRKAYEDGLHLEAEVDGFWAPIKYLNGRDVDVEGAIADIQLRAGLDLAEPTTDRPPASGGATVFLGLRYLGGGASGTGTPDGSGDGYTKNWLHVATLTLGARVR